jgi:GMP synthase-like glutamine amidotransferase
MSYKISLFKKDEWVKFVPKEVTIVTSNGNFTLKLPESKGVTVKGMLPDSGPATAVTVMGNGEQVQIYWCQNTPEKTGNVNTDGEPDKLQMDMGVLNNNDGYSANPDNLKLNISISYGDTYTSEFVISKEGVKVTHYTGFGSLYDKDTIFAFEEKSLQELITFFNRFGFNLNKGNFKFLDQDPNSFKFEALKLLPSFNGDYILVINNSSPQETQYITNIINYLNNRGIEHKIANSVEELNQHNTGKTIGCISTASQKKVCDGNDDCNKMALSTLKCPILGLDYGMHSMAAHNGANLANLDKVYTNNCNLSEYEKEHPLFKGVDFEKSAQGSFNFGECLQDCPQGFKTIAKLDDRIAGIANDQKKHYGLLFQPENIEETFLVLDNFISICTDGRCNNAEDFMGKQSNDKVATNDMKFIQTYERFRRALSKK